MESQVVLHNGFWWTRDDGEDGVTETTCPDNSCCRDTTVKYPDTPRLISAYVPKRGVMVQAGGNVGFYTKQYAEMFETVYTFEPIATLFYCLTRNVQNENVFKYQACLGDSRECVDLGRKVYNHAGSQNVTGKGRTPTLMIDDLGLPGCDLIQLDIEGYEFHALKGGIQTIRAFKPVIVIESACWFERYGTSLGEIEQWLIDIGYAFVVELNGDRIYKVHEGA